MTIDRDVDLTTEIREKVELCFEVRDEVKLSFWSRLRVKISDAIRKLVSVPIEKVDPNRYFSLPAAGVANLSGYAHDMSAEVGAALTPLLFTGLGLSADAEVGVGGFPFIAVAPFGMTPEVELERSAPAAIASVPVSPDDPSAETFVGLHAFNITSFGATKESSPADPIPSNVVLCYPNTNNAPPGATTWSSLTSDDRIPYFTTTTIGGQGGATTHTHPSAVSVSWSAATNQRLNDRTFGGGTEYGENASTHNHTGSTSVTFSGSGGNMKARASLGVRVGGDYVAANTVCFHNGAYSWSNWSALTSLHGYYLTLYRSQTGTGFFSDTSSHNHGNSNTVTLSTVTNNDNNDTSINNGYAYYSSHYHNYYLSSVTASANWNYQYIQPYLIGAVCGWSELPSGTVAWITNTSVPSGWSYWSNANGRTFYMTSSATGLGGKWGHQHSATMSWGNINSGSSWSVQTGTDGPYAMASGQSHAQSNGSIAAVNAYPPYIRCYPIRKN